MEFLYTARAIYDKTYCGTDMSWDSYIKWSRLKQLTELVSLDGMLNDILVIPDYNNVEDWNFIHTIDQIQTNFFTTLEYVLSRLKRQEQFNLLTVAIEPEQDCKNIKVTGYEFLGYDLLDQDFGISALSNCGGFDDVFLPSALNKKGLIDDFVTACSIKKSLRENYPEEHHADTNVIAVWRHETIGR